jgi:cytochrome c-type biogenesis protein CcmE
VTRSKKRPIGFIIGAIVVLAGFTYLLTGGISSNIVYFLTPGELLAKGASAYDAPVRLGGQVVPGTVRWDADALDLRFTVQDEAGRQVDVHSKAAPPQMFREGMGVIVEGRYTRAGVFESDNLMVKHSNEYRAPAEGHDPKEAYKSLMQSSQP